MDDAVASERRQGTKRERTRARLLNAAAALGEEKGFAASSLEEIAARAGVTKGAIYSSFRSKTEMVIALAESRSLRLAPAFVPGGSLATQLRAIADAVIEILPSSGGRGRLATAFQAYAAGDPDLRAYLAKAHADAFDRWASALARDYADTLAVPPRELVVILQSLSAGLAHQHLLTPAAVTPQVVRAAFDALARGATVGRTEA